LSEYIEKEAARPDEFCVGVSCQECPFLKDHLYGGCRVDDFIMALPPADVRPVVHGKWIVKTDSGGKTYGVCSCCGYKQYAGHLKYCPECGGKMDGPNQ
jgi:hypothetical protein